MDDTELEEGEACSYHNDEESNIDPDAFTYIDEKIQNILGHFKKDFEGGVSTENLGAKYGGYGSFLSQRSPVLSCSRSPANVQNNHSHKSPTCLSAEGGNYSSLAQSNGHHSIKHGSGSIHFASPGLYRAPLQHDPVRQIARAPFKPSTEESTTKVDVVDKAANKSEQRTLKVRIKVGSDSSSAKKNTAIYSGLGLVSPSSSFDDSPMGSEEHSQGFQFHGDESPTQIICIMTSFPIYGGHLLSPLPEGLARLTEKLLQDNKVEPALRDSRNGSILGCNGKTAKMLSLENGMKSEDKGHLSLKCKKDSEKILDDVSLIMKNQVEFDTKACEELVSEALKLPLLSDIHGTSGGKRGTSKQKTNVHSNTVRHKPLMPILSCDGDRNKNQNGNACLAVKASDERKLDLRTDTPTYPGKDRDSGAEAANSSTNTDTSGLGPKSGKGLMTVLNGSQKQNNGRSSTSIGQEGTNVPSGRDQLLTGGKKKQQESHVIGSPATKIPKESTGNVASGYKDSSVTNSYSGKKEIESFPKQKELTKARDKYKDFFGDMIEDGDDLMESPDEPANHNLKTSQICEKGLLSCGNNSRERPNKGAHEQLISKLDLKGPTEFDHPSDHVPPTGDPPPAGAPVENWVQCDKCLKWRLLPFGTKVDNFPEKWLCSMLNWLPGMNNCNITEEETTKAVTECYQPHNHNGLQGSMADVIPGATAANDLHRNQSHQDIFPGSGKNKHGVKDPKQELLHSVKSKSLTDAARSGLENELHFQHLRNSADSVLETNQYKKKIKKKLLDSDSDGGHFKNTKLEGRGEPSQDYARASKKMKTKDEDWMSTRDIDNEILNHNSVNELLISGTQKGRITNRASSSSQSSKGHTDNSLQDSKKKSKFQGQTLPYADCLETRNYSDSKAARKKRKAKSSLDALGPRILSGENCEMVNENDPAGKKKARMSMSEEKASSSSKGNSRIDKKRKGAKDHRLRKNVGSTLQGLDDCRSLKRELVSAATSSSSKVSDFQKSGSILQEVKNSPVESVSSSPFRTTHPDRFPSGMKSLMEKDSSRSAEILTKDDSKRSADLEDDSGGERSGAMRKDLHGNNSHQSLQDVKDGILVHYQGQIKHSLDLPSCYVAGDQVDTLDQHTLCTSEALASVGGLNQLESVRIDNANGLLPKQATKDSSRARDKNKRPDKGKVKISDFCDDSQDHSHIVKDKVRDIKVKFREEKSGRNTDRMEKDLGGKNESSRIMVDEGYKKDGKLKSMDLEDPIDRADSTCNHEVGSIAKEKAQTNSVEKRSKRVDRAKDEEIEWLSAKEKSGNTAKLSSRFLAPCIGNGADASCTRAHDSGDSLKGQMSTKKPDIQNGAHSSASKRHPSSVHRVKDLDAASPMKRDSHNQVATNALKEAKDLKHLADRKKNSGSAESTGLYFEAALKFLHGACLLESSGSENSRRGDMIQSMQVYSSTAKFFEFCAREYEKSNDLASAALAYKCMEVAYLRVIYSSNHAASRDRHALQTSLQMVPPGESPSSSASDLDNASNPATAEKAVQARDENTPQPCGNHVIAARNRPNFVRLLNFMQDVNSAMEASRKSQGAFAVAKSAMQQADSEEGMTFVKRVLDFNFHDVDGLLRLVRLALEAVKG